MNKQVVGSENRMCNVIDRINRHILLLEHQIATWHF